MKNILVPIDFTKRSESAKNVALKMAKGTASIIHFVHFYEPMLSEEEKEDPSFIEQIKNSKLLSNYKKIKEEQTDNKSTLQSYVDEASSLGIQAKMVFEPHQHSTSRIYRDILDYTENNSIDTTIMGSNGVDDLTEYFWGSNAQRIIRESNSPVLVVKQDLEDFEIKRIVVATDFKDAKINKNLHKVIELKNYFNVPLLFLTVNTPLQFESTSKTLQRAHDVLDSFDLDKTELEIYNDFSLEDGVIGFTKTLDNALIVLTSHGNTGVKRLLFHNHAESIVNHSKHPVLCYNLKNIS